MLLVCQSVSHPSEDPHYRRTEMISSLLLKSENKENYSSCMMSPHIPAVIPQHGTIIITQWLILLAKDYK